MGAYSEAYLGDVVENQGKLFDFVAQSYPDSDTEDFINTYMKSKTRKNIDDARAYVNTMDAKEMSDYFSDAEKYPIQQTHIARLALLDALIDRRPIGFVALGVALHRALCYLDVAPPHQPDDRLSDRILQPPVVNVLVTND